MISRLPMWMASFILCVTISAVKLLDSTIVSVKSSTFFAVLGSSAAVCSSNNNSFGFTNVAINNVSA